MEAERVSDAQMAAATGMAVRTYREKKLYQRNYLSRTQKIVYSVEVSESEILEALT